MLQVTYKSGTTCKAEFARIGSNIVRLTGEVSVDTSGFFLSRIGREDKWNYSDYTTIYRQGEGFIEYSNDGSVYVEPDPPKETKPITPGKTYNERITVLETQLAAYEAAYVEGVNEA